MPYVKLVAALVAANLVAIGLVACSAKTALQASHEHELVNPDSEKKPEKKSGWF